MQRSDFTGRSGLKVLALLAVATAMPGCAWLTDYQYVPPGESAQKGAPDNSPRQLATAKREKPANSQTVNNDDIYLIEHEGRLYVFDDEQVYANFMEHGETPYRLVRIGDGPGGATVVFGLREEDKSKSSGIASVDMYDGRLAGSRDFYAEVLHDNRFYVFSDWNNLVDFQYTREANLRYTEIGAGPGGRTVVYVLNENNKKERPVTQIERFHRIHN